jgi:hypothetical protein
MRTMKAPVIGLAVAALLLLCSPLALAEPALAERPTMADLLGVCGHYFFDGPTYAPVARHARNYHGLNWDLDVKKPYADPPYPFALNRVNWQTVYGGWRAGGFDVDASIQIGSFEPGDWLAPEEQAYRFGKAFGAYFGPAHTGLAETAELGNEPSKYSDEQYTLIAHAMARGLKESDPRLRVATAALTIGPSQEYSRSIDCYKGWMDLIDVLNVHTYAISGKWPNRRRTYPEDAGCDFLRGVRDVLAWRDANAPGKQVWVTEFGWDAHREGGAPLQEGVPIDKRPSTISRLQQAQFISRAFLELARLGVDRAYVYWYMDGAPEAGLHNASGLISSPGNHPATGVKHPAFYSMAALLKDLGEYRFARVLQEDADGVYAYEFENSSGGYCVAFWSPTLHGDERQFRFDATAAGLAGLRVTRAVELAASAGGDVPLHIGPGLPQALTATGTPRLVFLAPS